MSDSTLILVRYHIQIIAGKLKLFPISSTRKQKAKDRWSRQLSDVENVDKMLRSCSRNDVRDDQSEDEMNLDSGSSSPQQNSNLVGEDLIHLKFSSQLNTNSRPNTLKI